MNKKKLCLIYIISGLVIMVFSIIFTGEVLMKGNFWVELMFIPICISSAVFGAGLLGYLYMKTQEEKDIQQNK